MLVVGVTGGIGSGKSTLAAVLGDKGAVVLDADRIGHEELAPGKPSWHEIRETFGDEVLVEHSLEIDRKRLASIVFRDRTKLAALNAITHPRIFTRIADELEALAGTDAVVVLDAALMIETGLADVVDVLIVVTAPQESRIERLVKRGLTPSDASARIAAQTAEEELLPRADIVVVNERDRRALELQAEDVWAKLLAWTR